MNKTVKLSFSSNEIEMLWNTAQLWDVSGIEGDSFSFISGKKILKGTGYFFETFLEAKIFSSLFKNSCLGYDEILEEYIVIKKDNLFKKEF